MKQTSALPIFSALKKLTPKLEEQLLHSLEKDEARDNPFSLIEDGHLLIKTKSAELIPLSLNKAQKYVIGIIRECLAKQKPIRLLILKARQLGMSTLIEAIVYSFTSQKSNLSSLIIADDIDGSNYLFEMSKLYQERCPGHLRPQEKKSNEKKLEFDGLHSQILIDTAQNEDAGRKYTFRIVHLSEYAFFKHPERLMLGLSQSVPGLPGTMIVKESTANSFNHFKQEWDAAVNKENDYIPIFIPWYWDEGYRMSVEGFVLGDTNLGVIVKDERALYDIMHVEGIEFIEERLAWRRWCIKNNCGGSVTSFQQEYPSTPEEAFIASGDCAFDKDALLGQLRRKKLPITTVNLVKQDYRWVARTISDGDFKFWELIKTRSLEEYLIGGDACSGSGTDYAVLVAIGKRSNNVVATYRAKCDPDVLAEKAAELGFYLHGAEIAIENDKYGFHANRKLRGIYPNVFMMETIDRETNKPTHRFGWDTTSKTRADMIGQLKQEIREESTNLNDEVLIRECLTFIKNKETGKEEAQEGCNDDMVIARAIAASVRQMHPYTPPPREHREVPNPIPDY